MYMYICIYVYIYIYTYKCLYSWPGVYKPTKNCPPPF